MIISNIDVKMLIAMDVPKTKWENPAHNRMMM